MKTRICLLALLCCTGLLGLPAPLMGQANVPPPDVASYAITAAYDPATHTLTGQQTAVYHNRTADPIPTLVFHLYLNAFRSAETLWMRESGMGMRGYGFDPDAPGWIRIDQITLVDGTVLTVKALDDDETLVEAALPQPVAPGASVTVDIAFTAQFPKVFARTGWADGGDFIFGGQWFPKFGVWENGAWNAYPFHANSEFYADFGRYDVALTLPQDWIVAATGTGAPSVVANADGTATHTFVAEHVIDFAWAASPQFREMTREVEGIAVRVVYYPRQRAMARRALEATADALPLYNAWFGTYGKGLYPHLTVVIVPPDAGGAGGMEYPTLFTVGATGRRDARVPAPDRSGDRPRVGPPVVSIGGRHQRSRRTLAGRRVHGLHHGTRRECALRWRGLRLREVEFLVLGDAPAGIRYVPQHTDGGRRLGLRLYAVRHCDVLQARAGAHHRRAHRRRDGHAALSEHVLRPLRLCPSPRGGCARRDGRDARARKCQRGSSTNSSTATARWMRAWSPSTRRRRWSAKAISASPPRSGSRAMGSGRRRSSPGPAISPR